MLPECWEVIEFVFEDKVLCLENQSLKTKLWRCLVPQRSSWTFASKCQEDEVLYLEDQDQVLKVKLCAPMPPKQSQNACVYNFFTNYGLCY